MPTDWNTGFKLVLGTKTVVQMGSEAALTAWTRASDMTAVHQWLDPNYEKGTYPDYAAATLFLNNRTRRHGNLTFDKYFAYPWTLGMVDYLYDTFFPTGGDDALVTVKDYLENNDAIYITAVLVKPTAKNGGLITPIPIGWTGVRLHFNGGAIIT
jgi:hypothetical protein